MSRSSYHINSEQNLSQVIREAIDKFMNVEQYREDTHINIIDEETFELVQKVRETNVGQRKLAV